MFENPHAAFVKTNFSRLESAMHFVSKIKCKIKENPLLIFQAILIVLLIVLAIVFVVVMVSENPEWSFKLFGIAENGESKYKALKFLGIGMGGILVALQALASHRRAKAMEDTAKTQVDAAKAQANAAQAQARATEEQARANEHTEKGLRQERLKNAIEHLGDERDSVRLGGIYELFHLAEDSKDLRKTAFDMLCLHIRQTTGEKEYQKKHKSKPSEEVQSLLTLLFVQEHDVFKDLQINLQGSWLNGADLWEARLEKAFLTKVYLQGANLSFIHLQGADLNSANLRGVDLNGANLRGADLNSANLQGADLSLAQCQEANLDSVQFQGSHIFYTDFQEAALSEAQFQGADSQEDDFLPFEAFIREGFLPFEERIRNRIGQDSYLTLAIFGHGMLENSGAITGAYTEEEAEQWIAEYKEAMSEVPEEDS